ncbi:leucyl aminopeptidase [Prosthecochloris sp. GSB1]|uniref:leucyl aminopeptidase n=1 Tax=Prosthecochloris sp. GSB1 TaxID=281093 RepID=UPI000B8CD0DE|nr:leucyl aminopeptidase [Prosthecochloris sp. GSB1]ASQ91675.1 leucyl aminopeptidase [Prosthecochloris sp. GSB1]
MKVTVTKSSLKTLKSGILVIPFASGEIRKNAAKTLAALGFDKAVLKDFKGKAGDALLLYPAGSGLKSQRVLLAGLGDASSIEEFRKAALSAASRAVSLHTSSTAIDCSALASWSRSTGESPAGLVEVLVDAYTGGVYSFDRLKSGKLEKEKKKKDATPAELKIRVNAGSMRDAREGAERGQIIAGARALARDMVNMPGNLLSAEGIADAARESAEKSGCKVTVFDRKQIEKLGMGGLLAVNKGSHNPPTFTIIEYEPKGKPLATVALVGKGVTFDSGGISIKPSQGMDAMKCDMAGAAAVIGAVEAAARLELPLRIVTLVPATDNMPGGAAQTPGDVITTYSGITVEVGNTDAEGRLILADALAYAVAHYKPDAIIDLATLTGACIVALGYSVAGMFSNDDEFAGRIFEAGRRSGEKVWRMPLWEEYAELIKSEVADVHNTGGKGAGTITAAKFLEKFTGGHGRWAHLDIAGPAFTTKGTGGSYGGTGFGVRLLVDLLRTWT